MKPVLFFNALLYLVFFSTLVQALEVYRFYRPFLRSDSCESLDDRGNRIIDATALDDLENCLLRLPQTKMRHQDSAGQYLPERVRLHDHIIHTTKANKPCNDHPIALLVGGASGSGKGAFLRQHHSSWQASAVVIDADAIRSQLPEYQGWNAHLTNDETKDIVKRLLSVDELSKGCLHDLIYDGTMANVDSYLGLTADLKSLGYQIYIIKLEGLTLRDVWPRILRRYQETGRYVPKWHVHNYFMRQASERISELYRSVDGYRVVDASSFEFRTLLEGGQTPPIG